MHLSLLELLSNWERAIYLTQKNDTETIEIQMEIQNKTNSENGHAFCILVFVRKTLSNQ